MVLRTFFCFVTLAFGKSPKKDVLLVQGQVAKKKVQCQALVVEMKTDVLGVDCSSEEPSGGREREMAVTLD